MPPIVETKSNETSPKPSLKQPPNKPLVSEEVKSNTDKTSGEFALRTQDSAQMRPLNEEIPAGAENMYKESKPPTNEKGKIEDKITEVASKSSLEGDKSVEKGSTLAEVHGRGVDAGSREDKALRAILTAILRFVPELAGEAKYLQDQYGYSKPVAPDVKIESKK